MFTVLVLKTCDTCRKARNWLDELDVDYTARDVRQDPLSSSEIVDLVDKAGWETLINKSSTTWRGLTEDDKAGLDKDSAVKLLTDHPTLMKRPVFMMADTIVVGFKAAQQATITSALS